MQVRRQYDGEGSHQVELLDEDGKPIEVVSGFMRFLAARSVAVPGLSNNGTTSGVSE